MALDVIRQPTYNTTFLVFLSLFMGFFSVGLVIDQSECSTVCESRFCSFPPLLRYGPGEEPSDELDACCKIHDDCIGNLNNYLNKTCNHNLLECVEAYRASGEGQFKGNTCNIKDVEFSITIAMKIANHL